MDPIETPPSGPARIDALLNDAQPRTSTPQQVAITPWSVQSGTAGSAPPVARPLRAGDGKSKGADITAPAETSPAQTPREPATKEEAFLALHAAATKFQTGVIQLETATKQFASGAYIDSLHASLSGMGNLVDAGGDALKGLSALATLQENASWSKPLKQASDALKSLGTPLRGAGDVFKDLDALLHTYADPKASAQDIKLAFSSFLNAVARESGETLSTLNTSVGSANAFIDSFAAILESGGNMGLGVDRIRQNAGKLGVALRNSHAQKAASAVSGIMAGTYFLGASLTQAAAHALKVAGYSQLGEKLSSLGDMTSDYGEKYEALQERLDVNARKT
ncbi:MAG TPA: hypothetical protein VME63_02610 [Dyella sp.]|uniref:hypothetical protein n=1 Tax=Dyella sp. TaxID=1869338 RepID=UPI002CEA0628|nr:hypothetical protein [Dyella sp.]HTV84267.1 hypothetical protein [Dyella sp.]